MQYPLDIVEKNKKYSILNGSFSVAANSYGAFLSLYAINIMNANHQQVGLLNSLPAIVSLFTLIIGGYYFSGLKSKKRFVGYSIFSARFFLLLFAFIPFLPKNQAWVLVILVGLMAIPNSLTGLSWQSFIGDLIPERERGQFFSNRNRILTIVGLFFTGLIGLVLNMFDKSVAYPYQILFILSFVFGLMEAFYLFKHTEINEPSESENSQYNFWKTLKGMAKEKPFIMFLSSSMLFNFGWQMAWPLFNIYQVEYVKATAFWFSVFTIANQLSQILTYRWWGRMADRYGNGKMLAIATAGMATAPFLTVQSTSLIYLTITNLFTGVFLAGTNLLLFNQLLGVSPEKSRSSYITQYSIFIGLIGFIAPQVGVWLLKELGMNTTMYISSAIRLSGGIAFYFVARKVMKMKVANN